MRRRKKNQNGTEESIVKGFIARTLKFTETVVVWVTILYVLNWIVSIGLILLAIKETQNFAYLDTLIIETSSTFRDIVGISIIKFGVENVFKYNDFGGRVPNKSSEDNNIETFNDNEGGIG